MLNGSKSQIPSGGYVIFMKLACGSRFLLTLNLICYELFCIGKTKLLLLFKFKQL